MTAVGVRTRTKVSVTSRSIVYVANEIFRVVQAFIGTRDLPMDYLHTYFTIIMNGLRAWLLDRHLKGVFVEIYDAGSNRLVERLDLPISYTTDPGEERFETQMERVQSAFTDMHLHHPECRYRVVVDLEPGATRVPGWSGTTFREHSHLQQRDIGNVIDTAGINVAMFCWA